MKRRHNCEAHWACRICNCFQAISLRILLSHYNKVHGNEPNFRVVCNVNNCPAIFTKYNSFYKHVTRCHKDLYNEIIEENSENEFDIGTSIIGDDINPGVRDLAPIGQFPDNQTLDDGSCCTDKFELNMVQNQNNVVKVDIKKSAASFLLKVKERNKIPQVAMESVIDSTRTLIKQVVDSVRIDVLNIIDSDEKKKEVDDVFESAIDPFVGIETDALQSRYIKQNFSYVEPKEVVLGTKLFRKKKGGKRVVSEKDEKFVYIPILESLRQILTNERISGIILKKPKCSDKSVFYDVQDGFIYRNDQYFEDHENTLCLVLYHDELEVCNPLGSNAGVHKLDMYYFTIANLCPKFRSKRCAVHLFAIANADLVKKYSIDTIMQPLVDDLNVLHGGSKMNLNGVDKIIHGKVLMCTGDTLGQHYWGGYKEGVGAAFQKCRSCQCTFDQMQTDFIEEAFTLRTKQTYNEQCDAIEQAPTLCVQKDLETIYGLTRRSLLCKLPTFDVTQQLPQDIMHTILEGVVQYEVRLVLLHYIHSDLASLSDINGAILSLDYGYSEVSDKPGPLKDSVFCGDEKYKLKYKAAQARLFLRLLPFILGPLVDTDDQYYLFLMQLIQIVQVIFSPVIKSETISHLAVLIAQHLSTFKELFPNSNVLPKQHYMLHIPSTIRMLGPMVRSSCFSFESAHNYFKELARKQNFKNLPLSLAKRHQFNLCCNFGDPNEDASSHPLFSSEKVYGVLKKLDEGMCMILRHRFDLQCLLPGITFVNVYKVSWIKLFGTKYAKSGIIAVDVAGSPAQPVFGVITCIWSIHNFIYFDVQLLQTVCFDHKHQAYHVAAVENEEDAKAVYSYDNLLDFNVFHCKKSTHDQQYVPVKYYLGDVIGEHARGQNPLH